MEGERRKNIKIDPSTFSRLEGLKGEHETWAGFLNRLADKVEQ